MAKETRTRNILIGFAIFVVLGVLIWMAIMFSNQQTAWEEAQERDVPISLIGKAATISVFAYDKAANSPQTAKTVVSLYLIRNPVVTDTKISGEFLADGTLLSSSSRTDVTEGLKVGDKILGIALNTSTATFYGVPSSIIEITGQSEILDLDIYNVTTTGTIILKDEDETTLSNVTPASVVSAVNLTLNAGEVETFDSIRIKNTFVNTGWNVAGFYWDLAAHTNITSIVGTGTTTGSYSMGFDKVAVGFEKTDKDDIVFALTEPVMLLEYDYIKFSGIQIKADADGCAVPENLSLYVYDKAWFRSTKEPAMMFGAETDADSPANIGAADHQAIINCTNDATEP